MQDKSKLGRLGLAALLLAGGVALAPGCSSELSEEKARAAAERARDAIKPLDHGAAEQQIKPDVVKKVQEELTVLKEYMGPISGKLDPVTLNAFEAFQRSQGILPDGKFTEKTLELLAKAADQRKSKG